MKLWGGRFTSDTDKLAEHFHSSISFDKRLYREDIEGSLAHAKMLGDHRQGQHGILILLLHIRINLAAQVIRMPGVPVHAFLATLQNGGFVQGKEFLRFGVTVEGKIRGVKFRIQILLDFQVCAG